VCPCCGQGEAVDFETEALLDGAKIARFRRDIPASGFEDFWPVCAECLGQHRRKGFTTAKRSSFENYQADLQRWLALEEA
jgi:hypothetical protein